MDPDTALANVRALMASHNPSTELQDAWEALDGWLSRGGFPPKDWRN